MNVELVDVYGYRGAKTLLWLLLSERKPEESISHKGMPTWQAHCDFVDSQPYAFWQIIVCGHEPVGSIYLTRQQEIGIGIFKAHRGKGYAREAVKSLMRDHAPLMANINPENHASLALFGSLGFTPCQVTLRWQ
jgi:RimJ/RimL family protein N-acetyltransferase